MAGALASGMVSACKVAPHDLRVYDVRREACAELAESLPDLQIADSIGQAVDSPLVFLCVKPKDVADCLAQAGGALAGSLLVSIAAGVTLDTLHALTPGGARIIRVMPNTPALVGCGASAMTARDDVGIEDRELVGGLLEAVGTVHEVDEEQMDAVTAVSGSGPAFFYLFIEALANGGTANGLESRTALELAAQTALGAARMIIETGNSPADLREMVSSPGGTTLAGLQCLDKAGVADSIGRAVDAAASRAAAVGRR